ncbi:MAG TPA: F0F1 ATP synthase subunit delta [Candidatus Coprenecus pullistercoris]|nr:F0F1 ATP synthase subunit delta [Candidatus Coprenecus pullistercoris]
MTGIGLISRRYAKTLADYAAELGEEEKVYGQLLPLTEHYDYVPALRETVYSPVISPQRKAEVISSLFEGGPCRALCDFIQLVLRHRREAYLYFILHSFIDLYRERHHIKEAVLTTAVALGDGVSDVVRKAMQDRTECKINVTVRVDPAIIGGFVFRMEDTFIDASVATQLRQLRRKLGSNPARKI